MNTILAVAADIAAFWLSLYAFLTMGNDALGLAALGIALTMLVMTFKEPWEDYQNKKREDDDL